MYTFTKQIETRKGTFKEGQAVPPEWTGKETLRQLKQQFGNDVITFEAKQGGSQSDVLAALGIMNQNLARIDARLTLIEEKIRKK